MPQTVEIPDQGVAEFPDEMTPDEIKGVIQKKFYSQPTPTPQPQAPSPIIPRSGAQMEGLEARELARSPEVQRAAEAVIQAAPEALKGAQKAQQVVLTPASIVSDALTPQPVKEFMETPLVSPETVNTARQALQYPIPTLSNILLGGRAQEQGPLATAGKFASEQIAGQLTPENLALLVGTEGLGTAEKILAKRAPGLAETLFGTRASEPLTAAAEVEVRPPPAPTTPEPFPSILRSAEEQRRTETNAIQEPIATQPDGVRTEPQVPKETSQPASGVGGERIPEVGQGAEVPGGPGQEVAPVPTEETARPTKPVTPKEAASEPSAEPPGSMVGLSKDYISEDRAARGEEPLAQQARIGNEETWDKSEPIFAANPNAGHDLVKSLVDNPRAATPDDLGVLLRHRVNLANETDLFSEKALKTDISAPEKAEALQRLAALQDARNDADVVTRSMGATAGRSLQFLKQLSDQDYSLSSMLQERRVAMGGKPISPDKLESFTKQTEQYSQDLLKADQELQNYTKTQSRAASSLQAYKTRLEGATTELERRQAFSDYEPEIRRQLELDPEAIRLKANFEKVKNAYQKQLYKDTQANKPFWQKALGFASFVARESALSGIETLGKLAQFTGAKLGEIPLTETAERVWGKLPGFREIAQTSEFGPGANAKQLGEFYKEFATTGMKEAWQMLKGKGSATRLALEKEKRVGWPSFFGFLHGVEKTPLLIASQRMNRLKLMQAEMSKLSSEAIAKGQDVSNPLTQGAINYKAFQKATYDILQEQNDFASLVKSSMARMEAVKKTTGEVNATQAVMATLARVFLTKDIVRVPSNYIKQTLERTPLGLARGLGGAARAWYKGVGNVSPAERTAIMKLMGTGSIGSGFFVWGAIDAMKSPDQRTFGGYYQPGEKRDKTGDVHFGAIRPFGHELPHLFTHNPMTESAQMGSTLMRVALSQISKKDLTNRGLVEGVIKSIFGLAEQAPISGQAFRISKIGEPGGPTSVVGEAIRGLIPQLIQNVAKWTDQGEKRKPRTAIETAKLGIPGLRQTVPEKKKESNVGVLQGR